MDEFSSLKSAAFPRHPLQDIFTTRFTHGTYRLITALYILAGLCHLWLADAAQSSWTLGNIFFGTGLLGLLLWPSALSWLFAALGKLLPLLFGRDHLTQSMILLIIALGGALFSGLYGYRHAKEAGPDKKPTTYGEIPAELWAFFLLLKILTVATYMLAALHKLNRDFFHPQLSCATHGMNRILDYYQAHSLFTPANFGLSFAIFAVGLELSIGLFYLLGYRRLGLMAALIFHLPLTLTMAPAFAFVMLIGHAAFLRLADLAVFATFLRRFGLPLSLAAALITAFSIGLHGELPERTMIPREFLLWTLLGLVIFARPWHPSLPTTRERRIITSAPSSLAMGMGALFILHGLTPYTGLRVQHTAAMVSNLRVDQGCWNSLIFPETWRISDEYIRVDQAHLRSPGFLEKYEKITTEQLWSGPMIRQMRKNWCRDELRPFYLAGTWRGRTFEIPDLCAPELEWPFVGDGYLGTQFFDDHLRFQRNLYRECPRACIH